MSATSIVILGALAGGTILIGLPVGRMRAAKISARALLNATAIGVLVFLLFDILQHAVEPIDTALNDHHWASSARLGIVLAAGLSAGLLSLVYYERWMGRRAVRFGPGAAAVAEYDARQGMFASPSRRLSLLIATGIGLHNFSEGLAIGQSAAKGAVSLALLLVIGFGLHNATEGFGIVAPLAAEQVRPGWGFLGLMGLIGGGPTFVGTLIGRSFVNETVYLGFLALAAGSILYVVVQLIGMAHKLGRKDLLYWGVLAGLLAGFATDFLVSAAGG